MVLRDEGTTRFVRSPERVGERAAPFETAHGTHLPHVGEMILDCELVSELGRGTAGHVFLAQQVSLSYRPLVLKFMPRDEIEHLSLARLQHTHIMPLYWAADLPDRNLRMLAMPYLAATNLHDLLEWMRQLPMNQWSGKLAWAKLHEDHEALPISVPLQTTNGEMTVPAPWEDFVAWIGVQVAEALAFAHRQELVHLDLKPANIVLTPDGQPIILDFHVSQQPVPAGASKNAWLGGTPLYLSPEHAAGLRALSHGQPVPERIDGRSDIFGLGLILFEAFGGKRSLGGEGPADPSRLRTDNPGLSPSLADVVERCLAPRPEDRYQDAMSLADDLRRHLRRMPLRGVRNRSWAERWNKWRQRRPLVLPLLVAVAGLLLSLVWGVASVQQERAQQRQAAENAFLDGEEWLRRRQYGEAVQRFVAAQEFAQAISTSDPLHQQIERRKRTAERLNLGEELQNALRQMRFHAMFDAAPRRGLHVLNAVCGKLWSHRGKMLDRSMGSLELTREQQIESDLQEFAWLWSELQLRLAPEDARAKMNQEVDTILTQSSRELRTAIERDGAVLRFRRAPASAWEWCAQARSALRRNDLAEAEADVRKAVDLEPLDDSANMHLAVVLQRQKKGQEGLTAIALCLGQRADAEAFFVRGTIRRDLGLKEGALQDWAVALEKNATLAVAAMSRVELLRELGRGDEAALEEERMRQLQ
jgi:serine/threonine protein kinase